MAANFAARLDFAAGRHSPMEKRVEAGDAVPILQRLHMFEEGREAPDYLAALKIFRDRKKFFERHICFGGARPPEIRLQFFGSELAFERGQNAPFEVAQM